MVEKIDLKSFGAGESDRRQRPGDGASTRLRECGCGETSERDQFQNGANKHFRWLLLDSIGTVSASAMRLDGKDS